jgi:hypothetical protein
MTIFSRGMMLRPEEVGDDGGAVFGFGVGVFVAAAAGAALIIINNTDTAAPRELKNRFILYFLISAY